ncbi:hypothetical protein [Jiella sp. M17.18]|uniref:hypothetical protein n=1 Tax=Jiella sp. M17.18 TaxID=3234247 RepID=UPI0034DF2526
MLPRRERPGGSPSSPAGPIFTRRRPSPEARLLCLAEGGLEIDQGSEIKMNDPLTGAATPDDWHHAEFSFAEAGEVANVPFDTLYSWHRLMRAMDFKIGDKRRGQWWFSGHEMYVLSLLGALYCLDFPIGAKQIRGALNFADEDAGPDGVWYMMSDTDLAATMVDAPKIFWAVCRIVRRAQAALDLEYAERKEAENA